MDELAGLGQFNEAVLPDGALAAAALGAWDCGAASQDAALLARMSAHPRLGHATQALARNMLAAGAGDKALDGIFKDGGRYAVTFIALHLHFTGGLTLPRLKALTAVSGMSSTGRARAVLLYLRYLGFVTRGAKQSGAPDLFVPTARCHKAWGSHMAAALEAAAIIEPAALRVHRALDRPEIYASYVRHHLDLLMGAFAYPEAFTHGMIKVFMHRHGGSQILWSLILADEAGAFPPLRTRPVPPASLADRFSVSRTHVRRMIDAGERDRLLSRDGDAIIFAADSQAFLIRLYASQMMWLLAAASRTVAEHANSL